MPENYTKEQIIEIYSTFDAAKNDEKELKDKILVLLRLSESGKSGAMGRMGRAYRNGKGITKDLEKSAQWFSKACEDNIRWSCEYYDVSLELGDESYIHDALQKLTEYANQGDINAKIRLGKSYLQKNNESDLEKAIELFREAALKGSRWGTIELFDCLWKKNDTRSSLEMVHFITPFADMGDAGALGRLGRAYREGRGIPRNLHMAAQLFSKAAQINTNWKNEFEQLKIYL